MRAMLSPISYMIAALSLLALLLSIASALLRVCDWIEEDPARARRYGRIGSFAGLVLLLAALPTAKQPLASLCALSGMGHIWLHASRWPDISNPAFVMVMLLTAVSHFALVKVVHESNVVHGRPRLAGGRLDWDIPEHEALRHLAGQEAITPGEAASLTALLWMPGLWNAVAYCARTWGLPSRSSQTKSR